MDVLNQLSGLNGQQAGTSGTPGEVASECRTGADAERTQDCRIVGYVNSIQAYWEKTTRTSATPSTDLSDRRLTMARQHAGLPEEEYPCRISARWRMMRRSSPANIPAS